MANPSKGGIQGVLEQFGNSLSPSLLPNLTLHPLAFAPLPVGVLPPPVGQHKVCMAEDGREAQGL